jgi:hypothetical protein
MWPRLPQIPTETHIPLSDTFVQQVKHDGAKAGDKHTDGDGMYLHVSSTDRY